MENSFWIRLWTCRKADFVMTVKSTIIIIIIIIIIWYGCLFSEAFSSWDFSWNRGDPHRSGFKLNTAVLLLLLLLLLYIASKTKMYRNNFLLKKMWPILIDKNIILVWVMTFRAKDICSCAGFQVQYFCEHPVWLPVGNRTFVSSLTFSDPTRLTLGPTQPPAQCLSALPSVVKSEET